VSFAAARFFFALRLPALAAVLLLAPAAEAHARETAAAAASPSRDLVGQVLYVLNPTTVRTRGASLGVDLPRGQSVVLVDLTADRALLAPGPSDASLLRAYGVRKPPRYVATPTQIAADYLPRPAWEKARETGARRLLERWPDLTPEQALRIFLGQPYVGMTEAQAEEAVGPLVLSREPVPGVAGAVAWKVDRLPRSSELRLYNESRERGRRPATFDGFLSTRVRAVLTLKAGIVATIEAPEGQTSGLNWP
jgi:hypothetical protein